MDNPLIVPYIGERCPQCGKVYETAEDLKATRFGADAKPVHASCWDAYTGAMVQAVRELAEMLWMRSERDGAEYRVMLTSEDMASIRRWVRPAANGPR